MTLTQALREAEDCYLAASFAHGHYNLRISKVQVRSLMAQIDFVHEDSDEANDGSTWSLDGTHLYLSIPS